MSVVDVLNALSAAGAVPRRSGSGYDSRCPAHDDSKPSLHVEEGSKGGVVLTCYAGCGLDEILKAVGLDREVIRPPRLEYDGDDWTPYGPALDRYAYTDEDGNLLFEVCRCTGKNFPQRRPDPTQKSGWSWKLGNVRKPLYRLPKVLKGMADGETIYVAEGEKDVHALERAGVVATCNPGGAGKWLPEHTKVLADAEVVIVTDRDSAGRRHARSVAEELEGIARLVTRVEPSEGKDAFDHLTAGLTVDDFLCVSEEEEDFDLAPNVETFLAQSDAYHWLVPGLLERGDRLMLTGFEGGGKSEALRQIAVCVAAGLDPFKFTEIPPCKVLFIDAENSERHTRRKIRPLYERAKIRGPIAPNNLHLLIKPAGLDLTSAEDAAWLHERVIAHKPDLLIIGPLYRLHAQNPNDELAARATVAAIDAARVAVDCAVILEAHAGHSEFAGQRHVRPLGSSLWLRWPEFGYGLLPDRHDKARMWFRLWRGPRDERHWPTELRRGHTWPWEGVWSNGVPQIHEEDF